MRGFQCDLCGQFVRESRSLDDTATIFIRRQNSRTIQLDLCRVCTEVIARGLNRYRTGHIITHEDLEEN